MAKFVNRKLYWTASTSFCDFNVRKIISFDVAKETCGILELTICGEDNLNIKLGVVGRKLHHTVDVVGYDPTKIYAESIINPLRFLEVEVDFVLANDCMDRNDESLP
ncbi:hypothetical protein EJD97_005442 [Solanum chilense]|uniref:Uncharacterized protein n=1 Tax=Solanum chilense TaxID=4083 RepID=A0A6N2AJG0_SOLCI|nr:hypothetical protein EJD97_005442 [Solanum chilense]